MQRFDWDPRTDEDWDVLAFMDAHRWRLLPGALAAAAVILCVTPFNTDRAQRWQARVERWICGREISRP